LVNFIYFVLLKDGPIWQIYPASIAPSYHKILLIAVACMIGVVLP